MVPTLLVNGKRERRFQPVRDWLEQTHRNIQIVDLDGGHSVNVECPDAFNRVATAFLLEK
jgi:pimeloyl-ACP methyl ester carboxylesterase